MTRTFIFAMQTEGTHFSFSCRPLIPDITEYSGPDLLKWAQVENIMRAIDFKVLAGDNKAATLPLSRILPPLLKILGEAIDGAFEGDNEIIDDDVCDRRITEGRYRSTPRGGSRHVFSG